ncbi:MAG: hypothetical protein Q9208_005855 [Pyrenodesmia sp. 3 TL-2023]
MASPIVYTALSSSISETPVAISNPGSASAVLANVLAGPSPACVAGPDLCPDGNASPVYVGLGTEGKHPGANQHPPLAPMPFATPASLVQTTTALSSVTPSPSSTTAAPRVSPITTLTSILTQYTPSPSSSLETMMQGNPMPSPTYLHTSTIVGISIVGVLAFSIFPLLIFGLVMKSRLQKAKAFQLGQGPRRPLEWGREGWEEGLEERRREWVADDAFIRGFRRRVEGRVWI